MAIAEKIITFPAPWRKIEVFTGADSYVQVDGSDLLVKVTAADVHASDFVNIDVLMPRKVQGTLLRIMRLTLSKSELAERLLETEVRQPTCLG